MNTDPYVMLEAIGTICVLSYVWKENAGYRFFEFTAIGLAAAHSIVNGWHNYIGPTFTDKIFGEGNWLLLVPAAIGLLYYTRVLGKNVSWLARYPISLSVGYSVGYSLAYSPRPLLREFRTNFESFEHINDYVVILIWLLVMQYFLFTVGKRKESTAITIIDTISRSMIMVYMGVLFGTSILGKFSRLLGRYQFLLRDWLNLI